MEVTPNAWRSTLAPARAIPTASTNLGQIRMIGMRPHVACAAAALFALFPGCSRPPAPRHPNVVLVMIDTLRPDHLPQYGYHQDTAPYLAELAGTSAVFANAYSTSSWTAPAVASIFTGLYPPEHGIIEGFMSFKRREQKAGFEVLPLNRLPKDVPTIAQLFHDAGYRTFGIAANLNIGPEIGFDRGFDRFASFRKDDATKVQERLDAWVDDLQSGAQPYFLYLHFMDPHMPYHPRAPWYRKQHLRNDDQRARYDSEIHFLDQHLREIGERLGWKDALLLFVSDHGEEFREHGGEGHEFTLYRELNHVLFQLRPPGGLETPHRYENNVSLVDALPTLLDLAGLPVPGDLSGRSLVPLLYPDAPAPPPHPASSVWSDRALYAHREQLVPRMQSLWAVIRGDYKLIQGPQGLLLFDERRDPLEKENLVGTNLEAEHELGSFLARFRRKGIRSTEKVQVDLDPGLQADLEALGYTSGGD